MIAEFLSGVTSSSHITAEHLQAEDILATKECLESLAGESMPTLNCHESGSTLRFFLPVAMACRDEVIYTAEGRLPQRPIAPFLDLLAQHGVRCLSTADHLFPLHLQGKLQPGDFRLPGNISSQIVTGLLFALPLLSQDSAITLTSPMESKGYVEMTLQVLRDFQIVIHEEENCYRIPGNQRYVMSANLSPEMDWSGAAFWLAMNHLGSQITLPPFPKDSRQPDRRIQELLTQLGKTIDVSQCPDIFPVLAVTAAAMPTKTVFAGVARLRIKESDRLAAMEEVLKHFGVTCINEENAFTVLGVGPHFQGNITVEPCNDHRIAMATAVGTTVANGPVTILTPNCVRKSYPDFFQQYQNLANLTYPQQNS